jgi:hypothetical protein
MRLFTSISSYSNPLVPWESRYPDTRLSVGTFTNQATAAFRLVHGVLCSSSSLHAHIRGGFLIEQSTTASPSRYSAHSTLPSSPSAHSMDEPTLTEIVVTLVGPRSISSRPLTMSRGQMSIPSPPASRPRYVPSPNPRYLLAADLWCYYQSSVLRLATGCTRVSPTQADWTEATTWTEVEDQTKAPIGMRCVYVRLQTDIDERNRVNGHGRRTQTRPKPATRTRTTRTSLNPPHPPQAVDAQANSSRISVTGVHMAGRPQLSSDHQAKHTTHRTTPGR